MSSAAPIAALIRAMHETGVGWAFIGAAARNAWAPPRLTTDVDIAVVADAAAYARIVEALGALGYAAARAHRAAPADTVPAVTIFRNEDADPPYRQVDILAAGTDFEREAIARAVDLPLAGTLGRVVTREDLVVYKLVAWRPRDRQDIADVLATARAAGVAIDVDHVRRWAEAWEVTDRLEVALSAPLLG